MNNHSLCISSGAVCMTVYEPVPSKFTSCGDFYFSRVREAIQKTVLEETKGKFIKSKLSISCLQHPLILFENLCFHDYLSSLKRFLFITFMGMVAFCSSYHPPVLQSSVYLSQKHENNYVKSSSNCSTIYISLLKVYVVYHRRGYKNSF